MRLSPLFLILFACHVEDYLEVHRIDCEASQAFTDSAIQKSTPARATILFAEVVTDWPPSSIEGELIILDSDEWDRDEWSLTTRWPDLPGVDWGDYSPAEGSWNYVYYKNLPGVCHGGVRGVRWLDVPQIGGLSPGRSLLVDIDLIHPHCDTCGCETSSTAIVILNVEPFEGGLYECTTLYEQRCSDYHVWEL